MREGKEQTWFSSTAQLSSWAETPDSCPVRESSRKDNGVGNTFSLLEGACFYMTAGTSPLLLDQRLENGDGEVPTVYWQLTTPPTGWPDKASEHSRNTVCVHHIHQPSVQFSRSVMSTLCDPMNLSTPGLPVHHQLPSPTLHVSKTLTPILLQGNS